MAVTSPRFTHLLTFLLPPGSRRVVAPAEGWPFRCVVEFGKISVNVMGPSREATFATAARIGIAACADLPPQSISVRLYTFPPEEKGGGRDWLHVSSPPGGVDGWTMIVGAEVAFAPTALGATFPEIQTARPAPRAIER
jgi:hypothetical protein